MKTQVYPFITQLLSSRLKDTGRDYMDKATEEIAAGVPRQRFSALLSMASRHARREPLGLSESELADAARAVPGWSPADWNLLELLRSALVLARSDLDQSAFSDDFEALFRFADQGELCALYRCLPLLPTGERFVERAAEGCRTNMVTVFEAVALDSPYPAQHFDNTAWQQLVIKALFLDLSVYRITGLDGRLTAELTRMALDWADERVSAGRSFHTGLWLCLGPHEGQRVEDLIVGHWSAAAPNERRAMGLALARARRLDCLDAQLAQEQDSQVREQLQRARDGHCGQEQFGPLFSTGH